RGGRRRVDGGVVRVEDVHVRLGRKRGIERQPDESVVGVVVHVGAKVGEHGRRRVRQAVEHLHEPALLADDTRPSGENATTVGFTRPWKTSGSWKRGGGGGGGGGWGGGDGVGMPEPPNAIASDTAPRRTRRLRVPATSPKRRRG